MTDEYPDYEDPAYLAWVAEEEARGPLAFEPDTMPCYECCGFDGVNFKNQKVVNLGCTINPVDDPTQTYVLECGHVAF